MKRIMAVVSALSVLLISFSVPTFAATAPFDFESQMQLPASDPNQWQFVLADTGATGVLIVVESDLLSSCTSESYYQISGINSIPTIFIQSTVSGSHLVTLTYYSLFSGNMLVSQSITATGSLVNKKYSYYCYFSDTLLKLSYYLNTPVYDYSINGNLHNPSGFTSVDPFITWHTIQFSSDVIRSNLPQPLGNIRRRFFADNQYLYEFNILMVPQIKSQLNDVEGLDIFPDVYTSLNITGSPSASLLLSNVEVNYPVLVNTFDIVSGEFVSAASYTLIPDIPLNIPISSSSLAESGYYQSGFDVINVNSGIGLLKISWSDTIDYNSALSQINSSINSLLSQLSLIATQDLTYYSLVSSFINDFFSDSINGSSYDWGWYRYANTMYNFYYDFGQFYLDFQYWVENIYTPKTDLTNQLLSDILDAIIYNDDPQISSPEQTSLGNSVDTYESRENAIIGSQSGALNSIDLVLSDWDNVLRGSDFSNAFAFIRHIFDTYIFQYYSIFIMIPLVFGLIVLVLGRKVQR